MQELKRLIEASPYSQNDVCRRLGMHPGALCRTLSGQRRLKLEEAQALAALLRVPVNRVVALAAPRGDVAR